MSPVFKRFLLLYSYTSATLAAGGSCAFCPQMPLSSSFCSATWSHPSIHDAIAAATLWLRAGHVHGKWRSAVLQGFMSEQKCRANEPASTSFQEATGLEEDQSGRGQQRGPVSVRVQEAPPFQRAVTGPPGGERGRGGSGPPRQDPARR